jgi:hypothetical protein
MSRQELIAKLEWNDGGTGFGICAVANSMLWAMDRPTEEKKDLVSVVFVTGPESKYTTEELELIVKFAEERNRIYDRMFSYRRGCNAICIDKFSKTSWLRKRLSWTMGPMFSASLEEAIEFMSR